MKKVEWLVYAHIEKTMLPLSQKFKADDLKFDQIGLN